MKMDLFQKIVADAAIDAGSNAMIRQWLGQSPDHPVKFVITSYSIHYTKLYEGVIVDRYSNFIVCQFLSAGAERWKESIVNSLQKIIEVRGIYERSDVNVRKKEGLRLIKGRNNFV